MFFITMRRLSRFRAMLSTFTFKFRYMSNFEYEPPSCFGEDSSESLLLFRLGVRATVLLDQDVLSCMMRYSVVVAGLAALTTGLICCFCSLFLTLARLDNASESRCCQYKLLVLLNFTYPDNNDNGGL